MIKAEMKQGAEWVPVTIHKMEITQGASHDTGYVWYSGPDWILKIADFDACHPEGTGFRIPQPTGGRQWRPMSESIGNEDRFLVQHRDGKVLAVVNGDDGQSLLFSDFGDSSSMPMRAIWRERCLGWHPIPEFDLEVERD